MKQIRMDPEAYEEGADFSVTIATADRYPFFANDSIAEIGMVGLRSAAQKYAASVYAYCFMPDHVHLVAGVPGGISFLNFVRHFKQLTAYRFRKLPAHKGQTLWQRRFYDHALRRDEHLSDVSEYIWDNPVRAGLVLEASHYPFSGSLAWAMEWLSGSKDPDLQRSPPARSPPVGEGLQTLARSHEHHTEGGKDQWT